MSNFLFRISLWLIMYTLSAHFLHAYIKKGGLKLWHLLIIIRS